MFSKCIVNSQQTFGTHYIPIFEKLRVLKWWQQLCSDDTSEETDCLSHDSKWMAALGTNYRSSNIECDGLNETFNLG